MDYFGFGFILFGVVVFLISALGVLRMPDIYTRIHVGTKSTTLGMLLITFGAFLVEPSWGLKLFLFAIFILLTNPLSSSVIARASHKSSNNLSLDEFKDKK